MITHKNPRKFDFKLTLKLKFETARTLLKAKSPIRHLNEPQERNDDQIGCKYLPEQQRKLFSYDTRETSTT